MTTRRLIPLLIFLIGLSPQIVRGEGEDYRIGPEDVIQISVYDQPDLSVLAKVSAEGFISFPLLGRVKADGFTVTEMESRLETMLADGYLTVPQVSILMKEYRSRKLYVLGSVAKPGIYDLTSAITLLEAITRAGGLKADAARQAVITRARSGGQEEGGREPVKIDLRRLLDDGDSTLNILVSDGDVVQIPPANSYFVFGEVKSPGPYTLEKDVTVLEAIIRAGGFTRIASPSRTKIIRVRDGREETLKVDVSRIIKGDKNGDVEIAADDIIVIPESFF